MLLTSKDTAILKSEFNNFKFKVLLTRTLIIFCHGSNNYTYFDELINIS